MSAIASVLHRLPQLSLVSICWLALLLRVVWALLVPVVPLSDSAAYDVFAQNIWLHGTYGWQPDEPTSYWPVGTSAIYAACFWLFGHTYWPIVIFNIFCSLGVIVYTKHLVVRFLGSEPMAMLAALLLALWPTLIFFTTVLASELPYTLLVLAAFYHLTDKQAKILVPGLIAGGLFAAAYYVRPLAIVPLAIALFCLVMERRNLWLIVGRGLLVVTLLALLVAPWAYRNYQLYGAFVSMSTNGGATLWMGNHPGTEGGYADLPADVEGLDEYTRNQVLKQRALDNIKAEPVAFVTRTLMKLVKFHTRETIGITWNEGGLTQRFGSWVVTPLKAVGQLYWMAALALAFIGMILYWRQQGFWSLAFNPFILLWSSAAAIHAIIVAQDRYHIPIVPMVAIFAAYGIHYFGRKNRTVIDG